MFIIVPFIRSTGLAIVAEGDLLCGNFLSEKSCRHKMVVSTSFWSWLLSVSSVLTALKYTATFFGLLMRCGVHGSTRFLILVFMFLEYVFSTTVWLVKKS